MALFTLAATTSLLALSGGGCATAQRVANRPVFTESVEPVPAPGMSRVALTKSVVTPTKLEYEWQLTGDRTWTTIPSSTKW